MKKIVSITMLFLLSAMTAVADEIGIMGHRLDLSKSGTYNLSKFADDMFGYDNSASGTVSWNPTTKTLTFDNAYLNRERVSVAVIDKKYDGMWIDVEGATIVVKGSCRFWIETGTPINIYKNVTLKGDGKLKLIGKKACIDWRDNSDTRLTIDGPEVILEGGEVAALRGTSDGTSKLTVNSGSLHFKDGTSRGRDHAISNLNEVTLGEGIAIKTPHGAWFNPSKKHLYTINENEITSGEALIGPVQSYGFALMGYLITEANYDLIGNVHHFPNVGLTGVKYLPDSNELWLENSTISVNCYYNQGIFLYNISNEGLKIWSKGTNSFVYTNSGYGSSFALVLHADTEIRGYGNGSPVFDLTGGKDYIGGIKIKDGVRLKLTSVKLNAGFAQEERESGSKADLASIVFNSDVNLTFKGWQQETLKNVRLLETDGNSTCYPLKSPNFYYFDGDKKAGAFSMNSYGQMSYAKGEVAFYHPKNLTYYMKVCGMYVTDDNKGNITGSFIKKGKMSLSGSVLTLDNVTIDTSTELRKDMPFIDGKVVVALKGDNTLSCTDVALTNVEKIKTADGNSGKLTINSNGKTAIDKSEINVPSNSVLEITNKAVVTVPRINCNALRVNDSKLQVTDRLWGGSNNKEYSLGLYTAHLVTSEKVNYASISKNGFKLYAEGPVTILPESEVTIYDLKLFDIPVTSANKDYLADATYFKSGYAKFFPGYNNQGNLEFFDADIKNLSETAPTITNNLKYGLDIRVLGNNKVYNERASFLYCKTETWLDLVNHSYESSLIVTSKYGGGITIGENSHLWYSGSNLLHVSVPYITGQSTSSLLRADIGLTVTGNGYGTVRRVKCQLADNAEIYTTEHPNLKIQSDGIYEGSGFYTGEVKFVKKGTSFVHTTGVTLNKNQMTLNKKGAYEVLTATVSPSNATDKKVSWTVENDAVATVNAGGLVKAVSNGTTKVIATAENGQTATCFVTVAIPVPTNIILDQSEVLFDREGTTRMFIGAIVLPNDAEQKVTWSIPENDRVGIGLTYMDDGKSYARIDLLKDDLSDFSTVLTVTADNDLTTQCNVRIHYPTIVQEITLDQHNVKFTEIGQQMMITSTPTPAAPDGLGYIIEKHGDKDVASIDINGRGQIMLIARKEGSVGFAIWATYNGSPICYDYVNVRVELPVLAQNVELKGASHYFYAYGDTIRLTPVFTPDNVTNEVLTWKSSDESVATVDEYGAVVSRGMGYCTISATTTDGSNITSNSWSIHVYDPNDYAVVPATSIALEHDALMLFPNQRIELQASLLADGANTFVDWEVDNISGDGGRVEIFPYYNGMPRESWTCRVDAYVHIADEAIYPIEAIITARARDYEGNVQPVATCRITIVDNIIFTAKAAVANGSPIDMTFRVLDPNNEERQTCEIYGYDKIVMENGSPVNRTFPAIDRNTYGKLVIPAKVTDPASGKTYWVDGVNSYAFQGCNKLTEVVFPDGMTRIQGGFGYSNTNLATVTLPSTIKYLGPQCFASAPALRKVYMPTATPPEGLQGFSVDSYTECSIDMSGAFESLPFDAVLYVPDGCFSTYNTWPWTQWFSRIEEMGTHYTELYFTAPDDYGNDISYCATNLESGTCEVKGKAEWVGQVAPAISMDTNGPVVVPTKVQSPLHSSPFTVTGICSNAFADCFNITDVTLPATIEQIGYRAFNVLHGQITSVYLSAMTPPVVTNEQGVPDVFGSYVFEPVDLYLGETRMLHVPRGTKAAYDRYPWNYWFSSIVDDLEPTIFCDVNGDTVVDVADIASIIDVMAKGLPSANADVNNDGVVDVADIATVITRMAELAREMREF